MGQSLTINLLEVAALLRFCIWSHDVKQACWRSKENILSNIQLKPSRDLNLFYGSWWSPFMRLKTGDDWIRTTNLHLRQYFGMNLINGDLSVFTKQEIPGIEWMTWVYVDDYLACFNDHFKKLTEKSRKILYLARESMILTIVANVRIKEPSFRFELSQIQYEKSPIVLPYKASFSKFS